MRAANAPSPLLAVWRCWLVLLVVGYAVLIVVLASVVVPAVWRGSGIARPVALALLGIYALEGWALWRWAGQAAAFLPPTRSGRYVLLAAGPAAQGPCGPSTAERSGRDRPPRAR
jgi:hypothetical protein